MYSDSFENKTLEEEHYDCDEHAKDYVIMKFMLTKGLMKLCAMANKEHQVGVSL